MLSIIIPTLNASATLAATLESLRAAGNDPPREVIVVDGGSVDHTRMIAAEAGAIVVDAPRGRGPQLASGAQAAAGDWLLFLHADTRLAAGWGPVVRAFTADARNHSRAAYFRFALDDETVAARRLENMVRWRNTKLGLPYGDQGLLVSRLLYDAVGGYSDLELMEDVDLVRRIGPGNLVMLDVHAVTSAERYQKDGYVLRPLRNLFCLGLYALGVPHRYLHTLYR